MRWLIILCTILTLHCITDPQGYKSYLEPSDIKGVWRFISERPSVLPGLYEKDTVFYRIGMDSLPDIGPYYVKSPMTFYIQYPEGGISYGYIHTPVEAYDWGVSLSTLSYTLVQGIPGPTYETVVGFCRPVPDSLGIIYGEKTIYVELL